MVPKRQVGPGSILDMRTARPERTPERTDGCCASNSERNALIMPRQRNMQTAATVLLLIASPVVAEDAKRADLHTVRDFGAVGDGKADDTRALQNAVDARVGVVRLPRGVYRLTKPVVIDLDRVGPTSVVGYGVARVEMDGGGPAFKFVGTHRGTADPHTIKPNVWQRQRMPMVDGLEIIGRHERAVGIEATGTMQITVTRVNIRHALHGIHLTRHNRNVIVSDCHLYENRGVGLYLDDVNLHQITVTGSHISYNAGGGVVNRAGNVRNLHITGCDIEANMGLDETKHPPTANILLDSTGASFDIGEVAITGCTIQHTHRASGAANIRILGTDRGGKLRSGNVTITGNVLSDVQVNVHLRRARGVTITGNTFWKGFAHNLLIEDSMHIVVGPNSFDLNPIYQGQKESNNALLLRNCTDVTLTGLHINEVRRAPAGLTLENCRRINLTNCILLNCDNVGLLLRNVTDSRVSDSIIRNDRGDPQSWLALKAIGGSNNMIVDNVFGGRFEIDQKTAHLAGNITVP